MTRNKNGSMTPLFWAMAPFSHCPDSLQFVFRLAGFDLVLAALVCNQLPFHLARSDCQRAWAQALTSNLHPFGAMLLHDLAIGTVLLQSGLHLETPVLRPEQVADAQYWASTSNDTMSSCAAARAVRNFSWFSQTWAGSYTALTGSPAYSDPAIKTLDGVFIWDAEYCALSGLLDLPKEQLLQNYSAVMAVQEAACGTEPLKSLKLHALEDDVWTEVDEDFKIQEQKPPSQRKAPLQREGVLDRVSARHCAGGSYSCMVHFCLHNFCRQGDRIAQGNQCRSDFEILPRSAQPPLT